MARQLVTVCVLFLSLQVAFATLDIEANLKKVVEDIRTKAQDALYDVEQAVAKIEDDLNQKVKAEIIKIQNITDTIGAKLLDKVNELKEKAIAEGKAIKGCVEQVPGLVRDMTDQLVQEAVGCVTQPIKDGKQIIGNLIELALQINDTIHGLETAFPECDKRPLLERLPCKITVGGKAGVQITQTSTAIATNIVKAVNLVTGLSTNFQVCETKVWTNAPMKAAGILTTTSQCLINAVKP